ncbi:DUF2975 domain-containing protein [Pseudonocardia parietis]|uniref:DUF2975 family protein n=1 Tax=Pseudonocardia parietis TaxID=570936 RepID=A0ABS4VLG0_9PSEU|nr:DUF2975 domain-containing protein [Pseudonocardia parietis]MBP2364598.1 hypothetical protein [Pseudonocardia parietis]
MHPLVITGLRASLAVIALGALAAQLLIVAITGGALVRGELPGPGVFHSAAAIVVIACLQVALVAIWVLLSMVQRGAIFDERAFRWVRVIAVAGLVAAVIVGVVCAHIGELDDAPGLILVGGGIGLVGVAFALLMTVMLGLLRNATVLRHELEEVV